MRTSEEHPGTGLHAYLDGELSPEATQAVVHHLSECAVCRREVETYLALRQLLKSARAPAPEAETILLRVTRTVRLRQRRRNFVVGGAMAAAALLALVLFPRTTTGIENEVAAAHARALEAGRTAELASSDPAAIEQWLSARLPESVPPTEGGDGFALQGARVDSIDGRRVATLVYQVRGHVVDVFAWRSAEGDMEPRPTVVGRWAVCRWAHRGVAYWMVSDTGGEDLKALAAMIKNRRT